MAKYKSVVITDSGLELVAATHSGGTIEFTGVKTGNGVYDGTEALQSMTDLKSVRQTYGITGLNYEEAVVKVRSVISNKDMTEGYYLTEIGLYALDPNTGTEILYAIIVAEDGMVDYFTAYTDFPQSMTLEIYIAVTGIEEGVTFIASTLEEVYVTVQELNNHTTDTAVHITSEDRAKWNAKVDSTGTVANALNADKLGGLDSVKFLKPNFTPIDVGSDVLATADDDTLCPPYAVTRFRMYTPINAPLEGWDFFIEVEKIDSNWIKIRATSVRNNTEYAIVKTNGVWGKWTAKVDSTGGTIDGNIHAVTLTGDERKLEVSNSFHIGRLVVSTQGNFGVWDQSFTKWLVQSSPEGVVNYAEGTMNGNKVFHAGNSRPVVISSTAPADTTALWIQ